MILRGMYIILLGLFLALFVGIGVNTFYPDSIYQTSKACMAPAVPPGKTTSPTQYSPEQCQKDQEAEQAKHNFYAQVVSSIALICAVIYFMMSFTVLQKQHIFSYGFLFGCIFTLLYSLVRGLNSNQAWFSFIIVVISLVLVMAIGYLRFMNVDKREDSRTV